VSTVIHVDAEATDLANTNGQWPIGDIDEDNELKKESRSLPNIKLDVMA
jgi:hypothetical protein